MYKSDSIKFVINQSSLVLFLGIILFTAGCGSFDVPTPKGWSESLQVKVTRFTEEQTVSDIEARSILFTYHMHPFSQPIMVRKVEPERWIAVFEKPGDDYIPSEVRIERISESEYRVFVKPKLG